MKLWDLRKILDVKKEQTYSSDQLTYFINNDHKFTPESVRFLRSQKDPLNIISASKDATIQVTNGSTGKKICSTGNLDGFACLDVLSTAPFDPNI